MQLSAIKSFRIIAPPTLLAGITLICLVITGCGGGGGSSDGGSRSRETIFYGALTERGSGHAMALENSISKVSTKHVFGERLEGIRVCIVDTCSVTDISGRWGLNIKDFGGGVVTITVNGHGINSQVQFMVDVGTEDVNVDLAHKANTITVESLVIDGVDIKL
jgi:hypothetical protein